MKKILTTILIATSFSFLFANESIIEYNFVGFDKDYYREAAEEDYGINNPLIANIMTSSWVSSDFDYYKQNGFDCHYSFSWVEYNILSTFWLIAYIDSATRTDIVILSAIYTEDAIYDLVMPNPIVLLHTERLNMGLRFTAKDTLNVDTSEIRAGEFITTIKQDEELFAKLEFATTDTTNQYFAFGIGYIETLGSKDAFAEYGIDKTRPICFVATSSRHENKWDFCYSYADEEITELTCHSTVGIYEPSTIANLLVSPNPADANTTVTVDLETAGNLTVTLNNMLGQELLEIHNGFTVEGTFTKTFSLKELPIGMYYLKIVHNGNVKVEKVIRQ